MTVAAVQVTLQETKSMPEGAKERGVGLSGSIECVANVEKLIFEKLNARRVTSLAPSPAEVCVRVCVYVCELERLSTLSLAVFKYTALYMVVIVGRRYQRKSRVNDRFMLLFKYFD